MMGDTPVEKAGRRAARLSSLWRRHLCQPASSGTQFVFGDGSVQWIGDEVDPSMFRALITIARGGLGPAPHEARLL
jgi:hypothetical protein